MTSSNAVSPPSSAPLLQLQGVETSYGDSKVLFGVNLEINSGQCAALLGRNGMGKSTTVKTIMGLQPIKKGCITLRGMDLNRMRPHQIAHAGIGLVPEGRRVFPNLSVRENLIATAKNPVHSKQKWLLDDVYAVFPRLKERERHLGCNLSGGEQQMLAIGRALMTNPELLILDEATEGLAPIIRKDIWRCIVLLKSRGLSLLVIDKNLGALMRIADRHYILEKGLVVWSGSSEELRANPRLVQDHIGM